LAAPIPVDVTESALQAGSIAQSLLVIFESPFLSKEFAP